MLLFLKRIGRVVFLFLIHSLDACYDFSRYLGYSNSFIWSVRDRQRLESFLFFEYHKIEKALALPDVKPLFGLGYIESLLDLLERWVRLTGETDAVVFRGACASLVQYREHVAEPLAKERPNIARRLDAFLADYEVSDQDLDLGGTIALDAEELQAQTNSFDHLVRQRRSVRNFAKRHIPDSAIRQAVSLARKSPSVCNRQSWRVHVFTSDADKATVLQHQNGNRGFGHLADRVLLITADLRSFLLSGERHQGFTDAGMFAMTLLYALRSQGIASCCLNACTSWSQDVALCRACKIPRWETPVMMILIGYPPESVRVAAAARISTDAILSFRDLDGKAEAIDADRPQ